MATKGSLKGFYRQQKSGGVSKSKSKPKPTTSTNKKGASTTYGSDVTQPRDLISHGALHLKDDYNEKEEVLRQFDMNMAYGPCIGMTRLARLERAKNLGMKPPKEVEDLLKGGKVGLESLWDGRI